MKLPLAKSYFIFLQENSTELLICVMLSILQSSPLDTTLCQLRTWSPWSSLYFFLVKFRAIAHWLAQVNHYFVKSQRPSALNCFCFKSHTMDWLSPKALNQAKHFLLLMGNEMLIIRLSWSLRYKLYSTNTVCCLIALKKMFFSFPTADLTPHNCSLWVSI